MPIAARTLIAGSLLLVLVKARGLSLLRDRTSWGRFLFQACMNSVFPFTLIAWAEQTTDAGLATILNSTSPIFTFLLTVLITRHEAVTCRKIFGVFAGLLGVCLIVGFEVLSGLGEETWAQLAIVAATISYAGATLSGCWSSVWASA
ncbi:drug/metabolite transporter (DMT)-like permease [Rhizobium azooxidifex]|uniref:Drug/metabolite transporter (DMT)-like permease n=1 Tax=Mycoplana azooxidifex TaxID=1636188 RepID=A0A7W6DB22_9HYPH|nr:drug/metabolite transporter (DMT)-like permease [Mycoplana azooxidifex]